MCHSPWLGIEWKTTKVPDPASWDPPTHAAVLSTRIPLSLETLMPSRPSLCSPPHLVYSSAPVLYFKYIYIWALLLEITMQTQRQCPALLVPVIGSADCSKGPSFFGWTHQSILGRFLVPKNLRTHSQDTDKRNSDSIGVSSLSDLAPTPLPCFWPYNCSWWTHLAFSFNLAATKDWCW